MRCSNILVSNSETTIIALVETVMSILRPHFDDLEVVMVNDGSRDNTHATGESHITGKTDVTDEAEEIVA